MRIPKFAYSLSKVRSFEVIMLASMFTGEDDSGPVENDR